MRLPPPSYRRALAGLLLLVVALVLAARYLLRSGAPAPAETVWEQPVTAALPPLVVHVVGAVQRPGLYRFTPGSRIADAVRRAGGTTRGAELTLLNLAAPLADGEQIVVPRRGGSRAAAPGAGLQGSRASPVHLNTATREQLDALPGVGPATAQRILDYRKQHGAFGSTDELDAVPGIGPARLDELRGLVVP